MRFGVVLLYVALSACGRVAFDPLVDDARPIGNDVVATCIASPGCTAFACGASCYQYCSSAASWDAAQGSCVAWSGCLASIEISEELECFTALTTNAWIGLRQSSGGAEPDGGWAWTCGGPLAFTNWAMDEPNNQQANEECGVRRVDGTWNDGDCPVALPYVCERPI